MKKFIYLLSVLILTVIIMVVGVACGGNDKGSGDSAIDGGSSDGGKSVVPIDPDQSGDDPDQSGDDPDPSGDEPDDEEITGLFIVYNLGKCPYASISSKRQRVENGQEYYLLTPYVPVLSNYEFVGWKNALTGKIFPNQGVFHSPTSVYLEAVWVIYGPDISVRQEMTVHINYDLGECDVASISSNKQVVEIGDEYQLLTPYVPVLSNYEFVGWKNASTGEMLPNQGVFSKAETINLVAVWIEYGPSVV